MKTPKLTKVQLETLKSLPCRMHPDYKPILKLVEIGLAQGSEAKTSNPLYTITPAGEDYLKAIEP